MRECSECKWCVDITDSLGRSIYFCADADSDSYLEETGICGSCELEPLPPNGLLGRYRYERNL